MSNEKKEVHFDFNKPEDARRFLSGLWVEDKPVEGVQIPSGWRNFNTMSDDECMTYASQLANEWMGEKSKLVYKEPLLS